MRSQVGHTKSFAIGLILSISVFFVDIDIEPI